MKRNGLYSIKTPEESFRCSGMKLKTRKKQLLQTSTKTLENKLGKNPRWPTSTLPRNYNLPKLYLNYNFSAGEQKRLSTQRRNTAVYESFSDA